MLQWPSSGPLAGEPTAGVPVPVLLGMRVVSPKQAHDFPIKVVDQLAPLRRFVFRVASHNPCSRRGTPKLTTVPQMSHKPPLQRMPLPRVNEVRYERLFRVFIA